MHSAFAYLIAIMAFVIVLNFVMLFMRIRRDHTKKPTNPALDEEAAAIRRHKEIQRNLDREQEYLAYSVEMKNKMLDLYEEVRRRAAAGEYESAEKTKQEEPNP